MVKVALSYYTPAMATKWPTIQPPVPRELLPKHIAVIMDGNGRWARSKGLVRARGHEAGVEAVRDSVRYCGQFHVAALTLYAFSTENWKRPRREVEYLMRLLKKYLSEEFEELHLNGVRLTSIGETHELPEDVRAELHKVQDHTARNSGLNLCLALNYGAQDELAGAVRQVAMQVAAGEVAPESGSEQALDAALHTAGMPALDLLIRTAGERRLSNFLLWQASGAEFHVEEACWPDFRREHLKRAIEEYAGRKQDKRKGKGA